MQQADWLGRKISVIYAKWMLAMVSLIIYVELYLQTSNCVHFHQEFPETGNFMLSFSFNSNTIDRCVKWCGTLKECTYSHKTCLFHLNSKLCHLKQRISGGREFWRSNGSKWRYSSSKHGWPGLGRSGVSDVRANNSRIGIPLASDPLYCGCLDVGWGGKRGTIGESFQFTRIIYGCFTVESWHACLYIYETSNVMYWILLP